MTSRRSFLHTSAAAGAAVLAGSRLGSAQGPAEVRWLQWKTGEVGEKHMADVKAGFEKISNFTLGGLVPPLKITPNDHEGGGLVQIWQVKGGKFEKVTEWFAAYPDVVAKHIKAAAAK